MSGRRRFLPGFFGLLGMMILNGLVAGVVLKILYRLFGVSVGNKFGSELIMSAKRGEYPPLFDPKYR